MTEITAQSLTIQKDQGVTQALLELVKKQKMTMSDENISRDEWNATVDKIAEIQQARQKDSKPSIFTGGTDKNDWHKNFVVNPNQKLDFSKEEMESLYKTMGVSFANQKNIPQNNQTQNLSNAKSEDLIKPNANPSDEVAKNLIMSHQKYTPNSTLSLNGFKCITDKNGIIIKVYKNNKLIMDTIDFDGEKSWYIDHEYDSEGNEIRATNKENNNVVYWTDYGYDKKGHLVNARYIQQLNPNVIDVWQELKLDKKGNVIREINRDSNGKINNSVHYLYGYANASGRIVECTARSYDADGSFIKTEKSDFYWHYTKDVNGNVSCEMPERL